MPLSLSYCLVRSPSRAGKRSRVSLVFPEIHNASTKISGRNQTRTTLRLACRRTFRHTPQAALSLIYSSRCKPEEMSLQQDLKDFPIFNLLFIIELK